MTTLTVRGVDDKLVKKLKAQAKRNHRSLEAELREIIRRGVVPDVKSVLREMRRIRAMTPRDRPQTDSTLLIREDRDR
jgi:plasmid stability protein